MNCPKLGSCKRLILFQAPLFQETDYFKPEAKSSKHLGLQRHDWVLDGAQIPSLYKRGIDAEKEIHLKKVLNEPEWVAFHSLPDH